MELTHEDITDLSRRITAVEMELSLILDQVKVEIAGVASFRKWLIGIFGVFIIQCLGLAYGYGSVVERLKNNVDVVSALNTDRFHRHEATAMEQTFRFITSRQQDEINDLRAEIRKIREGTK